jgi:hypothetical protein
LTGLISNPSAILQCIAPDLQNHTWRILIIPACLFASAAEFFAARVFSTGTTYVSATW